MPKSIVVDASALIALICQETGGRLVEKNLSNIEISTVNLAEVASYLIKKGLDVEETTSLLNDLAIPAIPFDETQAFCAAHLVNKTAAKGLSLGDRACLALAMQKDQSVLTADKVWKELDLNIEINLIR
jgi:ribonuclease VapC